MSKTRHLALESCRLSLGRRWLGSLLTGALLALSAQGGTAGSPPSLDDALWVAVLAARGDQLELLKTLVNVDSGTFDVPGGRQVAGVLIPRLRALGAAVESLPAEIPGLPENTLATLTGTGKVRILIIGHLDTVFEAGTAAKWPFSVRGDRAFGPGVGDEKGGVVQALVALEILQRLDFRAYGKITVLLETSEERGSPGTRQLIDRLIRTHDVELNLEPGDPPDRVTVWRKGSTTFSIDVQGRTAHAGIAPEEGRNAALELIHQLAVLETFPHSGPGLTVNLTTLQAGTRPNIIPGSAQAQISVRVRDKSVVDQVQGILQAKATQRLIPDTQVVISRDTSFPPLAENPMTNALAARAAVLYARRGLSLGTGGNGGASESALAYEGGLPVLDGLGPVGGAFHTDKEWIDLRSLSPRLYLLAALIVDLSLNPLPMPRP